MRRYRSLLENLNIQFNKEDVGREDYNKYIKDNKNSLNIFIVEMSPEEFLQKTDSSRYKLDNSKVNKIKKSIGFHNKLPIPAMFFNIGKKFNSKFKSDFHDGMHRVTALKELGIKKILVKIIEEY